MAVDETKMKVRGGWVHLRAAMNMGMWEVLGTWVPEGRGGLEAIPFLRAVLRHPYGLQLVHVDCAGGYRWALDRLGGPVGAPGRRGPGSRSSSGSGILKHRLRRFHRRWPHNASLKGADAWIRSLTTCHSLRRFGA